MLTYNKGMMSYDNFCAVADNIHDYSINSHVDICGYGEPLLNKDVYKMIFYLNKIKLSASLVTNWTTPDIRDNIDTLLSLKEIRITLDGLTNEVYNMSRPKSDVNHVINNILEFLKCRESMGSNAGTKLKVRMNVFKFNEHQVPDLLKFCRDIGVDRVQIARGHGPRSVTTKISPASFGQTDKEYLTFSGFADENIIIPDHILSDGDQESRANNIFSRLKCPYPTIRWDGNLCPCCYDENGTIVLGNAVDDSISDIYSGENISAYENLLKYGAIKRIFTGKHIVCDKCKIYEKAANNNIIYRCIYKTILLYSAVRNIIVK